MDSNKPIGKHRNRMIEIAVLILALVVAATMVWRYERGRYLMERSRVSDLAGDHAHALQSNIERSLSATYALAALVRQGNGTIDDFDATAREMLPFFPGAASLQLAPGGVVRQIVPLAGNEGAIGHDLFNDPKRSKEAIQARDAKTLALAGPFELKQGGFGAVGRFPVYLDNGAGGSSFWGFTNVLIRFPEVLDPARLTALEKRGFEYALWRVHPDTGERQIIAASSSASLVNPVDRQMELPNGVWTLSVAPLKGWRDPTAVAFRSALGGMFALLIYFLTRSLLNTRAEARLMAEQLTRDLHARQQEFLMVFENSPVSIWEEDFTEVKVFFDKLKAEGVTDIEQYLNLRPETVRKCAELARIIDVNRAALVLHQAANKEELLAGLVNTFTAESFDTFRQELICLWNNGTGMIADSMVRTLAGEPRYVTVYFAVCSGYERTLSKVIVSLVDISERKLAEQERQANLKFFENMDSVNRAIQASHDVDNLMREVLDAVLQILGSDRAFLMYPCDPEAASWRVPMERTRPEYPGAHVQGLEMPMDADVARTLRELLASDRPVKFGPEAGHPLPEGIARQFGFRSFMSIAIYPKVGKPWQFGIHQCSYARIWTPEDEKLLQEIGRRLADALTGMLSLRDLRESEEKFRRLVDTSNEGIWMLGDDLKTSFVNARMAQMLGYQAEEMFGRPITDFMFDEDIADHLRKMENRRKGLSEHYERRYRHKSGRPVWTLASAVPIMDEGRNFRGTFAMFADIAERKQAEEAMLRLNQELDRRVKERTAELEQKNQELEQMNKIFVGRELRMVELKEKIRELEGDLS